MKIFNRKYNSIFPALLLAFALLLTSQSIFAIDLQTAKKQGLVGETASGYLAPVTPAKNDVKALVSDINNKRKQRYKAIAKRNATSLQAVEQLAGKKAIEKSKAGSYVKPNGHWIKK